MLANSKTRVIKCELDRDEYAMEAGKILKQMCAKINGMVITKFDVHAAAMLGRGPQRLFHRSWTLLGTEGKSGIQST